MKLERIHVDRFGAWNNLDLPVDSEGLSVFYGPNEAGKTTLMRFVRGVLYGFPEGREGSQLWRGALQVQHESESWIIERGGLEGTRGLVSARNADSDHDNHPDGPSLVRELVDDVSESVFGNVFAIGLYELQELATLESREVAEQIYSMSLGLDGQQLLEQIESVREASLELLDTQNSSGQLAELNARLEEIDRELDAPAGVRRRHAQLCGEQNKLEDSIVELKERQAGLESQLHGHEYMESVHAPWLKVRKLEAELSRLPNLPDFPEQGLHGLESIETEIAEIRGRRRALLDESRQLKGQAAELEYDPLFIRYSPVMQSFIDQRDWINDLQQVANETDLKADGLREQVEQRLEQLGETWTVERLAAINSSHLTSDCLSLRAGEFRTTNRRNNQLQKRYRRLNRKFHQRQELLDTLRKQLGEIRIADAIERSREELSQLEDLSRLRIRETELNQRRIGLSNQLHRMTINPALPQWVYAVFSALGISGGMLGLIGLFMGLTSNGVAGFAYMCVGLVCGGLTFALKRHFEGEVERTMSELRSELREIELRLVETRDAMKRVAPIVSKLRDQRSEAAASPQLDHSVQALVEAVNGLDEDSVEANVEVDREEASNTVAVSTVNSEVIAGKIGPTPTHDVAPNGQQSRAIVANASRLSEADLVRQCLVRLQTLEKMVRVERWVETTRSELIDMRLRVRDLQRDFGAVRQNWGKQLVEHGLEETVEVDAALEQRDRVARAALLLDQVNGLEADRHTSRRLFERLRKRVEELGHRLQQWECDYTEPVEVLDLWEEKLIEFTASRDEQTRLRRAASSCRRQASKFRSRLRLLNTNRSAILVRGGALSRDEFAERASQIELRFEVQEKVEQARHDLATVASGERSMAIVESDLEDFDDEQNSKCIKTLRLELDDLELDVKAAYETLDSRKQEIEDLEKDRSVAELRFDREQVLADITELAEEWFALEWTLTNLEELRLDFEKNHQPPILSRANEYLLRLSGGRYENIWTPLGKRTLCVDDRDGNTLTIENLSGGTRELLFLAIRFALIENYSEEGVELPIILDDVLVNFDHERTQAAVELLLKKTAENQQILFFTCHQHLAEMFRQRGVSTVVLPSRATTSTAESDELMAG